MQTFYIFGITKHRRKKFPQSAYEYQVWPLAQNLIMALEVSSINILSLQRVVQW